VSDEVANRPPFIPTYVLMHIITQPFVRPLVRLRIAPNVLTLGWGLSLLGAAYVLATDIPNIFAVLLILLAYVLDELDGDVARAGDRTTLAGQQLEVIQHVAAEAALITGAAIGVSEWRDNPTPWAILAVAGLCGGLLHYVLNHGAPPIYFDRLPRWHGLANRVVSWSQPMMPNAVLIGIAAGSNEVGLIICAAMTSFAALSLFASQVASGGVQRQLELEQALDTRYRNGGRATKADEMRKSALARSTGTRGR
jgi:DMSO reductase anchor subunit